MWKKDLDSVKTGDMKVKCPLCKKETEYSPENPYRPFCSERCRLIDLGMWASEDYRVASDEKVSIDIAPPSENEED